MRICALLCSHFRPATLIPRVRAYVSIPLLWQVLATGFATDFFDSDEAYELEEPSTVRQDSSSKRAAEDANSMGEAPGRQPLRKRKGKGLRGLIRRIVG